MKKIKKYIPAILYIVLLLVAVTLCMLVADRTDFNAEARKNDGSFDPTQAEKTSAVEDLPPESKESEFVPTSTITDPVDEDKNSQTSENLIPYDLTVPRNAFSDDTYLFMQKIFGDGATNLQDVIQTSVGIYAIVETTSVHGDVCGEESCVGIVRLDSYGNILSAKALDPSDGKIFVTASSSPLGLVVVTKSIEEKYFYVHVIPYDLTQGSAQRITRGKSAKIIPTQNAFLLFAEYDDESLVYLFSTEMLSFQSIPVGAVVDVFEYGTYYTVFSNDPKTNTYTVSKLSKQTLSLLQQTTFTSGTLSYIFPIMENQTQSFIAIEQHSDGVWVKKFTDNRFTEMAGSKKIGNILLENAFFDGEKIQLVCSGNLNGIIVIHSDLTTSFPDPSENVLPQNVCEIMCDNNAIYHLSITEEGLPALSIIKDNSISTEYINVPAAAAKMILTLDKRIILFVQNNDIIKIIGLKM